MVEVRWELVVLAGSAASVAGQEDVATLGGTAVVAGSVMGAAP